MGIKGLRRTDGQGGRLPDGDAEVARVKNTFLRNIHDKTTANETGARKTPDPDKWREDGMRFLGDNMFSGGETAENKSPLDVSRDGALNVIDVGIDCVILFHFFQV